MAVACIRIGKAIEGPAPGGACVSACTGQDCIIAVAALRTKGLREARGDRPVVERIGAGDGAQGAAPP